MNKFRDRSKLVYFDIDGFVGVSYLYYRWWFADYVDMLRIDWYKNSKIGRLERVIKTVG